LLVRLLEQVNEQLRLNRKAKYNIEQDIKNKFTAESIDSHAKNLGLTNPSIYLKNGTAKIEPKYENTTLISLISNVLVIYLAENILSGC
jgi:hypothetical protein